MIRLLGIDIGTSGCRAVVIDENGIVVAEAMESYPVYAPHPTWSEQDPEDWWRATRDCIARVGSRLSALGSRPAPSPGSLRSPTSPKGEEPSPITDNGLPITAMALTGQMHGAVFLDEHGEVIRPAILWNDQRTTEECEDIDRVVGRDRVREITLNPPLTGFQLPKILWLRKHEPENFSRVRKMLLPKDYIRYRLTGEYVSEVSDASGTGIFDVGKREWSREMMDALGLDESIFPQVVESCTHTGSMYAMNAMGAIDAISHLSSSSHSSPVPVFGGGGDQAAGAVGTGAVVPGIVSISLGTSGVVFNAIDAVEAIGAIKAIKAMPSPSPSSHPSHSSISGQATNRDAFHTFCHANGGWHTMGVMLACGGSLSWYASQVRHLSVKEVLEEAATAEPGCGGLVFLPYLSGERSPINDPFARGAFVGLDLSHGSKEMSRAVVEGATFGLRACAEAMGAMKAIHTINAMPQMLQSPSPQSPSSPPSLRLRVTGGGAQSEFWVQMIADVFNLTCETLETDQGPSFGAALIAGVGAGVWPSLVEACDVCIRAGKTFHPSGVGYEDFYKRYCDLYPHLKEWFGGKPEDVAGV